MKISKETLNFLFKKYSQTDKIRLIFVEQEIPTCCTIQKVPRVYDISEEQIPKESGFHIKQLNEDQRIIEVYVQENNVFAIIIIKLKIWIFLKKICILQ